MPISLTTLKGTSSISSDRITLNDNFKILSDNINNLLNFVNTSTAEINNYNKGANDTVTTGGITIKRTGLDIQLGNLSVQDGNLSLTNNNASITLGNIGSKIKSTVLTVGLQQKHILGIENFVGLEVPSLTTTETTELTGGLTTDGPFVIAFNKDTNRFIGWNGTSFVDLSL